MKNLNLLFAGALILLMYKTPSFLTDIATSIFGRAALVIVLAYTLIYCEFSCSIFFALIIIVLFHNTLEGFKEGKGIIEKFETDPKAEAAPPAPEPAAAEEDEYNVGGEEGPGEGKEEEEEEEEEEEDQEDGGGDGENTFKNKEGFLGTNMIAKKVLNKNFIGNLRNSLTNNLTDLDRFLKTKSEKNTIGATKQ